MVGLGGRGWSGSDSASEMVEYESQVVFNCNIGIIGLEIA